MPLAGWSIFFQENSLLCVSIRFSGMTSFNDRPHGWTNLIAVIGSSECAERVIPTSSPFQKWICSKPPHANRAALSPPLLDDRKMFKKLHCNVYITRFSGINPSNNSRGWPDSIVVIRSSLTCREWLLILSFFFSENGSAVNCCVQSEHISQN